MSVRLHVSDQDLPDSHTSKSTHCFNKIVSNLETAAATAADNGHGDKESDDSTMYKSSCKQLLLKSK